MDVRAEAAGRINEGTVFDESILSGKAATSIMEEVKNSNNSNGIGCFDPVANYVCIRCYGGDNYEPRLDSNNTSVDDYGCFSDCLETTKSFEVVAMPISGNKNTLRRLGLDGTNDTANGNVSIALKKLKALSKEEKKSIDKNSIFRNNESKRGIFSNNESKRGIQASGKKKKNKKKGIQLRPKVFTTVKAEKIKEVVRK